MPSPCFQFYPEEFVGSGIVGTADADEVCAYTMLLCLDWTEGGFVYDAPRLARFCKLTVPRFKKAWAHLAAKFPERDGRHYNPRLDKERAKQAAWREKSQKGAATTNGKRADAGRHSDRGGERGGEQMATAKGVANGSHSVAVAVAVSGNDQTTTPLPAEQPPEVREIPTAVNWPASVAKAWTLNVGPRSFGRIGADLKPFADCYPSPALAERALLAAVENFARHRRLAVANGNPKPDNWPQFVRDLLDYIPPSLKPGVAA